MDYPGGSDEFLDLDKTEPAREIPATIRDILALQKQPPPDQDPRPTG